MTLTRYSSRELLRAFHLHQSLERLTQEQVVPEARDMLLKLQATEEAYRASTYRLPWIVRHAQ